MTALYFIICVISGLTFFGILWSGIGYFRNIYSFWQAARWVAWATIAGVVFAISLSLLIQAESDQLSDEAQDCRDRGGLVVRRGTGTYIGCAEDR